MALVCDNPEAGALDYAREHDIRSFLISPKEFDSPADYTKKLGDILDREAPHLIALAGYLKKIPDEIVGRYPKKIINIHPSLLPNYGGKGWYGMRVHQAVIDNREKESGCTIHYVTNDYDEGPVIAQVKVPVSSNDTAETLAAKVLRQEHLLYPKIVRFLLSNQ